MLPIRGPCDLLQLSSHHHWCDALSNRSGQGGAARHPEVPSGVELSSREATSSFRFGPVQTWTYTVCMALDRQLLATKLFVARPPAGFVPRPRLVERLDAGLSGGLMLVCAPAGYGKTAFVSEWARRRPTAWLSLDPSDNDPARC